MYAKSTSDLHPGPIHLLANPRMSERRIGAVAQNNSTETFLLRVPSLGIDTSLEFSDRVASVGGVRFCYLSCHAAPVTPRSPRASRSGAALLPIPIATLIKHFIPELNLHVIHVLVAESDISRAILSHRTQNTWTARYKYTSYRH